jgi:arylsulfatase A-like enzyme
LQSLPLSDVTLVFNSSMTTSIRNSTVTIADVAHWGGIRMGQFQPIEKKPNIILISLDTLRPDRVSHIGYPRKTSPHLDSLAERGVYFKEAIANSPWTKPSHMSVFTGLLPSLHGVSNSWRTRTQIELKGSVKTLAELLKEQDYLTEAITGSGNIASNFGFYRGFDHYIENGRDINHDADFIFNNGIRWVEANKKKRFFLFLHTYEIHGPFTHKYFLKDLKQPTPQEILDARYDSGVYAADQHLGRFLMKLRSLDLLEDTILIVFSDHGEDLNTRYKGIDHGHTLYDEMVRCVLLVHCPKRFSPQDVENYQGQLIDIMPTVLDLAGIDPLPLQLSGTSLVPILSGKTPPKESFALSEALSWGPERKGLRYTHKNSKLKYIYTSEQDKIKEFQSPPAPGTGWLKQLQYFLFKHGGEELYDLTKDPGEKSNIQNPNNSKQIWLKKKIMAYLETIQNIGVEVPTVMDPDLVEKLKSLGY